jgi:hypothetical protein
MFSPIELPDAAGRTEQRDKMSARRISPGANAIGIEMIVLRVGSQPANRRFAVLYLGWKNGIAAQPVIDARNRITSLPRSRGSRADNCFCCRFATPRREPKRSAARAVRFFRKIQIEALALVSARHVGKIAVNDHSFRQRRRMLFGLAPHANRKGAPS